MEQDIFQVFRAWKPTIFLLLGTLPVSVYKEAGPPARTEGWPLGQSPHGALWTGSTERKQRLPHAFSAA